MQNSKVITGTYGSGKTECFIYCVNDTYCTWYAVEGSLNVNATYEDLQDGVNVEKIRDFDTMTAGSPVNSIEDLERLVNEEE